MNYRVREIYLYDDPDSAGLDVDYLARWLAAYLPRTRVLPRTDFVTHHLARFSEEQREKIVSTLAQQLARIQINNLVKPSERKYLPPLSPAEKGYDIIYDAYAWQSLWRALLPAAEARLSQIHIIFTAHYFGVWPANAAYLQLRGAIFGIPTIISTSGLIELRVLSKRYHFLRQQLAMFGLGEEAEEEQLLGIMSFGFGDRRINEIGKSYLLQALFYHWTGEIGCEEPYCVLSEEQSMEEKLRQMQRQHLTFCERHQKIFIQHEGRIA